MNLADRCGQPANSETGVTDCCREAAGLEKAEFSPPMRGMTSGREGGCSGGGGDRRLACGGVAGGPGGSGEDGTELLGEAGISAPGLSRFMRWCRRHFARLLENHTCVFPTTKRWYALRTRRARLRISSMHVQVRAVLLAVCVCVCRWTKNV